MLTRLCSCASDFLEVCRYSDQGFLCQGFSIGNTLLIPSEAFYFDLAGVKEAKIPELISKTVTPGASGMVLFSSQLHPQ